MQRICKALPVCIPPLCEKHLEQVMLIFPLDGSKLLCWFCKEQGYTMHSCFYFTLAQQRYYTNQSHVYNKSKALTLGASTGPRHVEPARTRVERSTPSRGKEEDKCQ